MKQNDYSAGIMSQSSWFIEFKMVVKMRKEGMDFADIKKACIEENLFGAATQNRINRMAGYLVNRIKTLDDTLIDLFLTSDLATQKIINLIAVLRSDQLFLEFLYEVYREKVILGAKELDDTDVKVFFTKKEVQSEKVAGWNQTTRNHLRSTYLNFMEDANLLTTIDKKKTITPPILDIALERYLIANQEGAIVKALTGEN